MRINAPISRQPVKRRENLSEGEPKFDPNDLKDGGYVLYFRHASAEDGHDDKTSTKPGWWRSTDPESTRQLDQHGIEQALRLGAAARARHVKVDHVLCSEFRRTHDTAFTLNVGTPEPTADLTPLVYNDATLPERIESHLNAQPEPGTNTFLVAHGHVTPRFANLDEGDAAVFLPTPEGSKYLGVIDYEDWLMPTPAQAGIA